MGDRRDDIMKGGEADSPTFANAESESKLHCWRPSSKSLFSEPGLAYAMVTLGTAWATTTSIASDVHNHLLMSTQMAVHLPAFTNVVVIFSAASAFAAKSILIRSFYWVLACVLALEINQSALAFSPVLLVALLGFAKVTLGALSFAIMRNALDGESQRRLRERS